MKIHHIGYLVHDIASAMDSLRQLGFTVVKSSRYDDARQVDIVFLENDGTVVELVAPRKEAKNFRALQKRIGDAPYHLCYLADDFAADVDKLQQRGWAMIQPPQPAVAIDNRQVAFFYHQAIGMIELVEQYPRNEKRDV
ncbi:MAG: VOC family protein [Selenomonadaceae bacterium]|nr:VOC family protein [Selenomonadaceae bacterium]